MKWLRSSGPTLIVLALGLVLGRLLFPKTVTVGREIPTIVTQHDTVRVPWERVVHRTTTDTFNLVVRETIHDTVVINVHDSTTKLWPIVGFTQLKRDTANVRTFELTSGRGAVLTVYTPGPLTGIYADSTPAPQMNFGTWPVQSTSTFKKLFYGSLGFGVCRVLR